MTSKTLCDFKTVFPDLPQVLRDALEKHYTKIQRSFSESRYELSELNGAKFSETVLRVLEWKTTGIYTRLNQNIANFGQKARQFENQTNLPDGVRFHIPKLLDCIFDLRNKRGVGHVSDLDPNYMDATFITYATAWIMAELVRWLHQIDANEAQKIVSLLVTKRVPVIWEVDGKKRVLETTLSYKEKTLIILYREYPEKVNAKELGQWLEHSNLAVYRRDILRPCHKERLLEYDETEQTVIISPLGIKYTEENIPNFLK